MNVLHLAINRGLSIHPVKPRGKEPLLNRWPEMASSDPQQIATANPSSTTVSAPPVETAHAARPSAHARKLSAKQAATPSAPAPTASPSSDTVVAEDAAQPAPPVSPSPETASPADAAVPAPAPPVTHRAGSLPLLIAFVVLVIVLGTMAPLIGRWRKRKMLERNGRPNRFFTNKAS